MSEVTKAGFDITKLSGTALSEIKKQNDEISTSSSKKRDYLGVEDGSNKFRFFPAHPDSDENCRYAQKKTQIWYKIKSKEEGKEGEMLNRSCLNAREHAGQEKDLVEEYHKLATEQIKGDGSLSNPEKAAKLKIISDFQKGIKHSSKFMAYAIDTTKKVDEEGRRGLLEITTGIKKKLDAISLAEIEEDPTGADIISDPVEGVTITIKKDPKKPNTEKYSVSQGRKPVSIEQADVDWWIEEDSLVDILFKNPSYHKGTLKQLLEGIQNYDDSNEIGVADTDEFLEIYDELSDKLEDAPVYDDDDSETTSKDTSSKGRERAPRKVVKALGDMSKAELKDFIMEADLDVRVLRKDTVEIILEAIEIETDLTADNFPSDYSSDSVKKEVEEEDGSPIEDEKDDVEESSRTSRRARRKRD